MGFAESFQKAKEQYDLGGGGKKFIDKDEYPIKCAVVGDAIFGYGLYNRSTKTTKPASPDTPGASFKFAVNVWDGSDVRVFNRGGKALFAKLGSIGEGSWIEIGKVGDDQMSPYYAKKVGGLTGEELDAVMTLQLHNLAEVESDWYEDEF